MKLVNPQTKNYYDLFSLLDGLEEERSGIRKRIWEHLIEWGELDSYFKPHKDRITSLNLFYYGVGDEYPIPNTPQSEIEHSKNIHPNAFIDGTPENELRKDLNLIWFTYNVTDEEIEMFNVMPSW